MSFNRLLADAPPEKAAQAALVMAEATRHEPGVPDHTKRIAEQLIALGVDKLTDRIRAQRAQTVASELRSTLPDLFDESDSVQDDDSKTIHLSDEVVIDIDDVHGGLPNATIDRQQAAAIREWARRNHLTLPPHSRIPRGVITRFVRANEPGSAS